jgi:hypothetical protein
VIRFFLGLFFGIVLTVESVAIAGVGHGSYAPLVFTASVGGLVPFLGLLVGPFLWGLYFLIIPNVEKRGTRLIAFMLVFLFHFCMGLWVAVEDGAFLRTGLGYLLIFGVSALVATGSLLFLTFRRTSVEK